MQQRIANIKHLEPYFKIAQNKAKESPCVRRQYGALITSLYSPSMFHIVANNARASNCCKGICARNLYDLPTTGRHINVEIGAEVHAETAALIDDMTAPASDKALIVVGYKGDRELLGEDVWPCHVCALNIKYAGFSYIYCHNNQGIITPYSIADVIEYREAEWEPDK